MSLLHPQTPRCSSYSDRISYLKWPRARRQELLDDNIPLALSFRPKKSTESVNDVVDNDTWQSHLFRSYDAVIGLKRIRQFPPRIPEHPSVLISKDTATNKACQTICIRNLSEAYMEPSEYVYILHVNNNKKNFNCTTRSKNSKMTLKLCYSLSLHSSFLTMTRMADQMTKW